MVSIGHSTCRSDICVFTMILVNVTWVVNDLNSYAKLGLTLSLNPLAPGGFERSTDINMQEPSPLLPDVDTADHEPYIPSGFGRILRDDVGNIIGFEASESEEERPGEVAEVEGLLSNADVNHERWVTNRSSRIDAQGKRVLEGELIKCCVSRLVLCFGQ